MPYSPRLNANHKTGHGSGLTTNLRDDGTFKAVSGWYHEIGGIRWPHRTKRQARLAYKRHH